MKRSMIAGAALVAAVAVVGPMPARSADSPQTQAAPAHPAMPGMDGMGMMGSMRDHAEAAEHRGWMRERMMRRMAYLSPEERCVERLARRAGMIAYTVAKLNLTPQQRPTWDRLSGLLQQAADKERQLCAALKPGGAQADATILDRLNRREQFLSARLEGLRQARPALEQLYQTLTPEQKAIIDHPFRRP